MSLKMVEMKMQQRQRIKKLQTWKVPRVELVDVDLGDDGGRARRGGGTLAEVVEDEFLVRRVEPEPWREGGRHAADDGKS
jgi:hypothetical protein